VRGLGGFLSGSRGTICLRVGHFPGVPGALFGRGAGRVVVR
jgi:hypothetical protein